MLSFILITLLSILVIVIIGLALGIFIGLLVSMVFTLGLFLLSNSPKWKHAALTGTVALIVRSVLAAGFTYTLAFHGILGLGGNPTAVGASAVARYFAVWAALVAFIVGVNMLRLIPLFVHRKTAD